MIKLDDQARRSLQAVREDLARTALERKQLALAELEGLDQQIAGLEFEQEKLTNAEQRLQAKVSAFRTKKEIIKAQYSAAQAQVRIGSALSGLCEEMGDISLAVERAETKTENLRAGAGAIDELASTGVLDDAAMLGGGDDIERQLRAVTATAAVEGELAVLKAGLGPQARELPEGRS